MPIKGVSEVVRLPRLGKIKLGIKKENAEGIPYPLPKFWPKKDTWLTLSGRISEAWPAPPVKR